ncbi:MAG TPA: UvrD-helicase domain-containing protein [Bacillota bacterium]|nr:UvrD-helicase domain-containing protein [Bacillota bacterium]HPT87242.1 UvrD-helicase domain-containing protein [Bacillota bacterium]
MAHAPNEQQAKAIETFDWDILVSAGAGTGKTSVLTEKYLYLLKEYRVDVSQIVAITFTNKAAAEMLQRIRQGVERLVAEAADPLEIEYWKTQLQKMAGARIATFHSFCLGLIKEHPLEAGISPGFTMMNEGESLLYLNQVIDEVLTELYHSGEALQPEFERLLAEFGWQGLLASCRHIYQTIRESGKDFSEVLALTTESLNQSRGGIRPDLAELVAMIDALMADYPSRKLTPRAIEVLGEFKLSWPEFRSALNDTAANPPVIQVLRAIGKGLPKNLPAAVKEDIVAIRDWIDEAIRKYVDEAALSRLPLLEEILARIDRRYQQLKVDLGLLDFTDQQLLARNMLRDYPQLAEKLRQGIRYLLVDEFQDTNSLQMDLIRSLIGTEYTGGRWMAVGDVKQSIYRFRGAEAGLIVDLRHQFEAGAGEIIPLSQNYRSASTIIDYVNAFSAEMFQGEDFTYEALQSTRIDPESRIEFLLTGTDDIQVEARMVAARIRQLVDESRGTEHPVDFKDIVILFRASSGMGPYQAALQEAGIPYYTSGGSSFYSRPEIVDQLNLLRLVDQAYDGVALFALLKSPYAGISEANLLRLGRGEALTERFYEETDFRDWNDPAEVERFQRFRQVILYLQSHRDRMKIAEILRYAIENLNYKELCWVFTDGSQRLANLEKLMMKADEFAAKGFYSTTGFLTYVTRLIEAELVENDAPTQGEANNVVRLMTIHRSKGLEFPVVILANLDHRFRFGRHQKLSFHKNVGIGFKVLTGVDEYEETSVWERIKASEKREEISELKRLLYVALTRAKRHLIMAGSGCSTSKGDTLETANNWMKWFEILHPFEEGDCIDFHGVPIHILRQIAEALPSEEGARLIDTLGPEVPLVDSRHEVAAVGVETVRKPMVLKATGIVAFKDCPRRFLYRYIYGIPEPEQDRGFQSSGSDGMGTEIGTFLHQAARFQTAEWPETLWERFIQNHRVANPDALKQDLERIWMHFSRSEYNRFKQCWDEVPFILKIAPEIRVEGRFDRLLLNEAGELVLVDYKTHRISKAKTEQVAAHYFWQVQLYGLAVRELWGRLPDRAELYFPYPDSRVAVPLDQASLDKLVAELRDMAEWIRNHRDAGDYPVKIGCSGCGYKEWCFGQ